MVSPQPRNRAISGSLFASKSCRTTPQATVTDTADTLTGLPSGQTANLQITAVNAAGESGPSAEVQIAVP